MTDSDSSDESFSVSSKSEAPSRVDSDASLSDVEDADGSASKPEKKQKIIFDFFKVKKKRGRPKKAKPKHKGRPPRVDTLPLAASRLPIEEDDTAPKAKKTRINWTTGENAELLSCAARDWNDGKAIDMDGDKPDESTCKHITSRGFSRLVC